MAQRAGRAIRQQQSYREPERVATTKAGMHFVPVVQLGACCLIELRLATTRKHPTYGWASYPAKEV